MTAGISNGHQQYTPCGAGKGLIPKETSKASYAFCQNHRDVTVTVSTYTPTDTISGDWQSHPVLTKNQTHTHTSLSTWVSTWAVWLGTRPTKKSLSSSACGIERRRKTTEWEEEGGWGGGGQARTCQVIPEPERVLTLSASTSSLRPGSRHNQCSLGHLLYTTNTRGELIAGGGVGMGGSHSAVHRLAFRPAMEWEGFRVRSWLWQGNRTEDG